jgi:polyisoprenoid-binding protein YceI
MTPQRQSSVHRIALVLLFAAAASTEGFAQERAILLEFAPAQTSIEFTLEDPLHTVHGAFNLKHGQVRYDPATRVVSGEIVVDTTNGHSGSNARDSRMHREMLESAKYPETVFRPDRADAKLKAQGTSTVQVHGIFNIHGTDHEITIPVQVEMAQNRWTASAHFEIPYVKWGIKNPSNFFLHVSQTVAIDIRASGPNP